MRTEKEIKDRLLKYQEAYLDWKKKGIMSVADMIKSAMVELEWILTTN